MSTQYNLTLKSAALKLLASHVGTRCGQSWRSACEPVLDEIAKAWRRSRSNEPIVDEEHLLPIIRALSVPHPARPSTLAREDTSVLDAAEDSAAVGALGGGSGVGGALSAALLTNAVDPRQYFSCIGAFDQPQWRFDEVRQVFESRPQHKRSLLTEPSVRTDALRERYHYLLARLRRHENFQAPAVPMKRRRDRLEDEDTSSGPVYHRIIYIKNLLGRQGGHFMLFGYLTIGPDGDYYLEDPDDRIKLDLSRAQSGGGWFVPGCFVLLDGTYTRDEVFRVDVVGQPPAETRRETAASYGGSDFLGLGYEQAHGRHLRRAELALDRVTIVTCAQCHLDNPRHLAGLRKCFSAYEAAADDRSLPLAIVLIGDFASTGFFGCARPAGGGEAVSDGVVPASPAYKKLWDDFATLLEAYPRLCRRSKFVIVPGASDPWSLQSDLTPLPRKPIPPQFTTRLARALGENLIRATNPCRLAYFTQEIVVLRDDPTERFRRQSVRIKSAASAVAAAAPATDGLGAEAALEETQHDSQGDVGGDNAGNAGNAAIDNASGNSGGVGSGGATLRASLADTARTLLSQANLAPFSSQLRLTNHDFARDALRLLPAPDLLILAEGGLVGDALGGGRAANAAAHGERSANSVRATTADADRGANDVQPQQQAMGKEADDDNGVTSHCAGVTIVHTPSLVASAGDRLPAHAPVSNNAAGKEARWMEWRPSNGRVTLRRAYL